MIQTQLLQDLRLPTSTLPAPTLARRPNRGTAPDPSTLSELAALAAQAFAEAPAEFDGLAADRRGDILLQQGKKAQALAEFQKALKGLDARADLRRLVEVKVAALGGDPATSATASTAAKP